MVMALFFDADDCGVLLQVNDIFQVERVDDSWVNVLTKNHKVYSGIALYIDYRKDKNTIKIVLVGALWGQIMFKYKNT